MAKKYYGTVDIAKMINFHQTTIANWIDQGKLKSFKTIGGHRKVEVRELLKFLQDSGLPIPSELQHLEFKLLLIDHDAAFCDQFSKHFCKEFAHACIIAVGNPIDALIHLGREAPEFLVLDAWQDAINGKDIIQKVCTEEAFKKTRVLICSPKEVQKLGNHCQRLQQNGHFFKKPVDFPAVCERIRTLL